MCVRVATKCPIKHNRWSNHQINVQMKSKTGTPTISYIFCTSGGWKLVELMENNGGKVYIGTFPEFI
jgi:putative hemolysin